MTTFKHAAWSAAFLSTVTAAITLEVIAAATKDEDLAPLCYYAVRHVPKPVALGAIAVFCTWFPGHLARAYRKAGK